MGKARRDGEPAPVLHDRAGIALLSEQLDVLAVGAEHADRARARLRGADAFGQDRVEHLLRRHRLGEELGDPLESERAVLALVDAHCSCSAAMPRWSSSRSPRPIRASTSSTSSPMPDRVERLDEVADAAELRAAPPVGRLCASGEEDDGDVPRSLVLGELAGDAPPVEAGHHHVEKDQVRLLAASQLEGGLAVVGLEHVDAGGAEIHPAEKADRLLVVDDEDASGLGACARAGVPAHDLWLLRHAGAGLAVPELPSPLFAGPAGRSWADLVGDFGFHAGAGILGADAASE